MAEQDLDKLLQENMDYLEGAVKTVDYKTSDILHVAVCGDGGSGKTNLIARTCRKPLLDLDFDDRKASIAGIPDVVVKTMTDVYDDNPIAWSAFENTISSLEALKNSEKLVFKSVAISSMTYLRKYAEHQALKDKGSLSRATIKVGQSTYLVPKDWDAVTGVQHMLETAIQRLFNLNIDVYVEFHLRDEKDKNKSTKLDPVYKENFTVEPENLKMLLPKFNEVWRTYVDNDGGFKMQIKPDWLFGAKTALSTTQTSKEVPQDIKALIDAYNSGR